ncbi:HET-domain-containing protein [Annulohypoxylon bovei var. microspora]|nr:HET-domain-containing protein [Annulohypoxylon bovei var. microspora]
MAFTSKSPHTCEHCQRVTLDFGLDKSTTQFSCGVEEAVAADQAGCPLFHAFMVSLEKKNIRSDDLLTTHHNLTFSIRYEEENLPDFPADLVLRVDEILEDETGNIDVRGYSRVSLWTSEDNAASVDITTRPYELDPASPVSIEFARRCIQSCQNDHEQCRRSIGDIMARQGPASIDPNSIPSRLLHLVIHNSELHIKLIGQNSPSAIEKEAVSHQGFAILSYCWGGPQPIQLTHDNINYLGKGIPVSQLPKSLRDAAWFTNEIGLKYLWIDALCIFQDDIEDKVHEISRMELYYGQSTVTICAASAAKCSEGFIVPREEDVVNYNVGPIKLRAKTSLGTFGSVQALAELDYFNGRSPPEPIILRGWTLQEALLSRRILIFSSHHLYFTCTVANASCGGFEPILKARVMTTYQSRVANVHTISGLRDYPVTYVWRNLVNDYTQRYLGFPADKLPAVSALASSLIPMAKERNQKLVYLAGLMLDTSDPENYSWRNEFLWRVHQTQSTSRIPTGSPSWSWSSLSGRIITCSRYPFSSNWNIAEEGEEGEEIRICEYGVELKNEIAPFSAVKGGYVKIHVRTRSLGTIGGHHYKVATESNPNTVFEETDHTMLVLVPDTAEGVHILDRGIKGEQQVFLVELVPFYETGDTPTGLIVTDITGTDHYVRVGIFEYQHPEDNQNAAEVALRKALFNGSKFEYVHIV